MSGDQAGIDPTREEILIFLWHLSGSLELFVKIARAQDYSLAEIDSCLIRVGERQAAPD